MKKTIIALLALGGVTGAVDELPTWTFSNGTAASGSNYVTTAGLQFSLSNTATSYAATSSEVGADFPEIFSLETFTIAKCGQKVDTGVWGILSETSTGVAVGAVHSGATTANRAVTFDFSASPVAVKADKAYTLTFIKAASTVDLATEYGVTIGKAFLTDEVTLAATNKFIVYAVSDTETYSNDTNLRYSDAKVNGAFGAYTPAVSITAKAIPEPTTATLSLLALADLSTRRRRK